MYCIGKTDSRPRCSYSALSLVFSTNVVCVKTQQKTCQYQKYNQLKNMIQWHVFISVPQHYNPYSGNFARRASSPTWPTTIYIPIQQTFLVVKVLGMLQHTNPLSLNWSWYWETFIKSSCQNAPFLKSKNRQKGGQFLYQMSDFCENCNPHSSYHDAAVGECLVDIWFAEICQLTLCVFGSQSMLDWDNRENVSFRDRDRKRLTRCHMASENFDAVLLLNIRVSI